MSSEKDALHRVLINDEEQYSLWPAHLPHPEGWRDTGVEGSREDCVLYVDGAWADMRPKSLRDRAPA